MKEIRVTGNEAGKRLDSFLNAYLKNAGKSFIFKMLRKKNITLNGKKAAGTEKLSENDIIQIFFSDETFLKFRGETNEEFNTPLDLMGNSPVIYEDENIILLNKPAGVLSQKSSKDDFSVNDWLITFLLKEGKITKESLDTFKPSICNRLDRNTSGLIICAKTLSGSRLMNSLIKERKVRKFYRTVISGKLCDSLTLSGYLYKDEKTNKVKIVKEDPKDDSYFRIETRYFPLKYYEKPDLTLLEVELITGKPHQIRAHLSSINHPIIGDVKYGGIKVKGLSYQLLHSYKLTFPDDLPNDFQNLCNKEFTAPLPAEFERILN